MIKIFKTRGWIFYNVFPSSILVFWRILSSISSKRILKTTKTKVNPVCSKNFKVLASFLHCGDHVNFFLKNLICLPCFLTSSCGNALFSLLSFFSCSFLWALHPLFISIWHIFLFINTLFSCQNELEFVLSPKFCLKMFGGHIKSLFPFIFAFYTSGHLSFKIPQ